MERLSVEKPHLRITQPPRRHLQVCLRSCSYIDTNVTGILALNNTTIRVLKQQLHSSASSTGDKIECTYELSAKRQLSPTAHSPQAQSCCWWTKEYTQMEPVSRSALLVDPPCTLEEEFKTRSSSVEIKSSGNNLSCPSETTSFRSKRY